MTNRPESQYNIKSPEAQTFVQVVAYLDDLGGRKYFLKDDRGRYFWMDSDLETCTEANEGMLVSAVTKHDYQLVQNSELFAFEERKAKLRK